MKRIIFLTIACMAWITDIRSQEIIANWESGESPLMAPYPAEVNPQRIVNPWPEGANKSYWIQQLTSLSTDKYELAYTNPKLSNFIDFTDMNAVSVKVRSDVTGNMLLKLSNYDNQLLNTMASAYYYADSTWQEIIFYLPEAVSGTYNVLAVFPDFENERAGTWYIDDIRTCKITVPFSADTIVDNDTHFRYFQAWSAPDPLIVPNPVNLSNPNNINKSEKCMRFTSTGVEGEGIKHVFESNINFDSRHGISMMVYSADKIGIIELRLEGTGVATKVLKYQYTTPGLWQNLIFDITGIQSDVYNLLAIVPDYNDTVAGNDWYFDEITLDDNPIGTFDRDIIADFDNNKRIFEHDGGTGGISIIENPVTDGINSSAHALRVNTVSSYQYENFGTDLERKLDFASSNAISMLVYSDSSGSILLKLQGQGVSPVEINAPYYATNPASWQRVRFKSGYFADNAYDNIQIFPDFGQARDGIWLFDELKTENIPVQGNIIVNFDEFDDYTFDDWNSTGGTYRVTNPNKEPGADTSNTVLKMVTVSAIDEGAKITDVGLDFTNANSISLNVYVPMPVTGIVQLRLEGTNVPEVISHAHYTTSGHWQMLTFDLTDAKANPTAYNLIAIRPDYSGTTPDIAWYFDDFSIDNVTIVPFNGDVLANFETGQHVFEQVNTNGIQQVENPLRWGVNTTDQVLKVMSSNSAEECIKDLRERNLDFTAKNAISVDVLSSKTGMFNLKLEKYGTGYPPYIAHCQYVERNKWQKLTFDLTGAPTNVYNTICLYPDLGNTATDIPWYLDEFYFETAEILPFLYDTIVNFDNVLKVIEEWGTNGTFVVGNPARSDVNASDSVLQVITSSASSGEGFKTVLDRNMKFSSTQSEFLHANIYSSSSGKVQLTLEGKNAPIKAFQQYYTATNPPSWQTISFNISDIASDAYNLVALLPDAEGNADNKDWYFDDIAIVRTSTSIRYADWDGTVTGTFTASGSGASVSSEANPVTSGEGINVGGNVLRIVNSLPNTGAKEAIGKYIDFTGGTEFIMDYYSDTTGKVCLQLEGTGVPVLTSSEADYTKKDQWQRLTFEFDNPKSDVYNFLSVLPCTGGTWYIDNLEGPAWVPDKVYTGIVWADWDTISPARSKVWGNLTDTITENPLIAGINQSNQALKVTTDADSLWEGFSINCPSGVFDFSTGHTFALDVYSTIGATVNFKLENSSVSGINPVNIELQYTKPGSWQQLVFTFDSALMNKYNRLSVFPDFLGAGTADWYFDNIRGSLFVDKIIILQALGGIAEGKENGREITVNLIGDTFKPTPWVESNFVVHGLPSPVTVGSVNPINPATARIVLLNNATGSRLTDDRQLTVTVKQEQMTNGLQDITGEGVFITAIGDFLGTREKKVFVHYLPWYNDSVIRGSIPAYQGWRDLEHNCPDSIIYSNVPLIGEYSQMDEDVLEYQFLTMYAAGVDGLIINLVPSREYEKVIVRKCLDKLKEMNRQYAASGFNLQFIVSYDEKDTLANIWDNFLYVRDSLTNSPAYSSFCFNDPVTSKPVIITWDQLYPELYHPILYELYNDTVIHLARGDDEFELCDGNMEWINYLDTVHSPVGNTSYWGEDYYDNFHRAIARQDSTTAFSDRNYICMGAVWPGFDDHNAPWRENKPAGRWMSRNVDAGETMALTFDKLDSTDYIPGALGNVRVEIPWIQVATWNDWPEGTSIEPATACTYGYNALKTTAYKTAVFKGTTIDTSRIYIPYAIYLARKNNQPEVALCLIDQLLKGSSYTTALNECSSGYCRYIPMPVYAAMENENYSGAACIKMILDLEKSNTLTQTAIQNYAVTLNSPVNLNKTFIDPWGMYRTINHFGASGYNYGEVTESNLTYALKDICYWISNPIPNVNHPYMPSVIPVGGSFNNWLIVNGFRSDINPHYAGIHGNFTVRGFYVRDPDVDGIGQDIYIQAEVFGINYFKPISSSDGWNNKYVTVDEPPIDSVTAKLEPLIPGYYKPVNDRLRFQAAQEGLNKYLLIYNDARVMNSMEGSKEGRTFFVDLPGKRNDYYIVTFERDGGCTLAAIIDANDGALKEVSFDGSPDRNYYDNLISARSIRKSTEGEKKIHNSFYPSVKVVNEVTGMDADITGASQFDFELVPNPARDKVEIITDCPAKGVVHLQIFSITGVLLRSFDFNVFPDKPSCFINLQRFEKGMYLLTLTQNGEKHCKKLIVE